MATSLPPAGPCAALVAAEHAFLALALATGLALMIGRGWAPRHARWFGLKLGLVVFLLIPLEGMHAYCQPRLDRAAACARPRPPPFSKDLARGIGMEDMLRALAIPLLGLAVPAAGVAVGLQAFLTARQWARSKTSSQRTRAVSCIST